MQTLKNKKITGLSLLILTLIFIINFNVYAAEKIIIVKEYSEVSGPNIFLNQIAVFKGLSAQMVEKLSKLNIGDAAMPGNTREISAGYLKVQLQQSGIQLKGIKVKIPEKIMVNTLTQKITKENLFKPVKDYITSNIPESSDNIQVDLKNTPSDINLPIGKTELKVSEKAGQKFIGFTAFPVEIYVNDQLCRTVLVNVYIEVYANVLVASKDINKNEIISIENITLERKPISRLPKNILKDAKYLEGYRVNRAVSQGSMLTTDNTETIPLFEKGKQIDILVIVGDLEITTRGEALEDGRPDKKIRVKNLATGKIMQGIPMDENTVVLDATN